MEKRQKTRGWRIRRLTLAGAVALGVGVVDAAVSTQAQAEQPTTVSFSAQGCSTWTVPSGVTSLDISAVGAAGNFVDQASGLGDGVSATLSDLDSNQALDVCVDVGGGSDGEGAAYGGGSGGGASGVSLGNDFSQPVVVAGGGGGTGGTLGSTGGSGGAAGYPTGSNGDATSGSSGGGGGTSSQGGAVGSPDGQAGSAFSAAGPGAGGSGSGDGNPNDGGGGGGGGGYYGGGGGGTSFAEGGSGGGGGSDFCSGATNVTNCAVTSGEGTGISAGTDPGDAVVTISYVVPPTTTSIAFSAPSSATAGGAVTLSATVSPAPATGTVAFSVGGNPIGSCTAQAVDPTTGVATCATTAPTLAGEYPVSATFSDASGANTTSSGANTLDVVPGPVASLSISPASASITTGSSETYTATGYDQYGNSLGNVTGSTTFAIAPNGSCTGATCTAATAGTHTVSATDGSVSGQATLDVTAATATSADLAVKISGPGSAVTSGTNASYTVTVTNKGPGTASGVTTGVALDGLGSVRENVPAKSGSALGITGVLFTQATLSPNATLTYVISGTVTARAGGSVGLIAATGSSVHDPDELNNLAAVATPVAKAPSVKAQ